MGEHIKPPLGLRPRWVHDGERIRDIFDAMERYSEAGIPIPIEWLKELREYLRQIV